MSTKRTENTLAVVIYMWFLILLERINRRKMDHTIVAAYKEMTRNTERFKLLTDNRHTIVRTFSIISIYKNKKGESFLIRLLNFTNLINR
jgi:hypothetical protein